MAVADTTWYRTGTISIESNSSKVHGSNTLWETAGINPGATLRIDGTFYALEILKVVSDTEIDLRVAYTGEAVTNSAYSIDRNFQSTLPADIAAGVANMTGKYERYIDSDLQKITGESAYDIAVKNGFVGTESQWLESLSAYGQAKKNGYTGTMAEWLESLKAAGEWSSADTRLTTLESSLTGISHKLQHFPDNEKVNAMHNLYPRYKNLGTSITAAQYAAINDGSYNDLYIGDYWNLVIDGKTYRAIIAQCGGYEWNPNNNGYNYLHIFLHIANGQNHNVKMNDTNTTEGGYLASKMHTEILPKFTTKLEAKLGAEHIFEINRYLPNSNTYAEDGTITGENTTSQLELLSVEQVITSQFL